MLVDTAAASAATLCNSSNLSSISHTKIEKISTSFCLARYLNGTPPTKARSNGRSFFLGNTGTGVGFCFKICFGDTTTFGGIAYVESLVATILLTPQVSGSMWGKSSGVATSLSFESSTVGFKFCFV